MKIRRLTVRNFRGIEDQTVDFTDADGEVRPLTVIVGPNRSGKTTLLDALHLVDAVAEDSIEPALRPGLDDDDPRLRLDANRPIDIEVALRLDAPDELAAYRELARIDDWPTDLDGECRLQLTWPRTVGGKGLHASAPPRSWYVFRARSMARRAVDRRVVDAAILDRIGGLLYLDQRRAIETHADLARPASAEQLADWAATGDILPWIELQARLDVRWDPEKKGKSGWTRLRELFARLARPAVIDDMEPFPDGYDLRLRDTSTGRSYYLAGASSGERMMLRLAASLTAFGPRRSVVLIDEVELHLHPRWQRNLLHFCKLGAEGDTQFIVTTHSDTILRYVDPDAVVVLGALDG